MNSKLVFLNKKLFNNYLRNTSQSLTENTNNENIDNIDSLIEAMMVKGDGVTKISSNNDRLYIPLKNLDQEDIPSSEIEVAVRANIESHTYGEIYYKIDYSQGLVYKEGEKEPQSIENILATGGKPRLLKQFKKDPNREKNTNTKLFAVISNNEDDLFGNIPGKGWASCKNLRSSYADYTSPKKIALDGAFKKNRNIHLDQVHRLFTTYLILEKDKNITKPLSRINIIPYKDSSGRFYYYLDNPINRQRRGLNSAINIQFIKTVQKWFDKKKHLSPAGGFEKKEVPPENLLINAAFNDELDNVKLAIQKGAPIDYISKHGHTALQLASQKGYLDIVKFLVKEGADIEIKNKLGYTALFYCFLNNSFHTIDTIFFLIKSGANIHIKTDKNQTLLMLATNVGNDDVVKLLIEKGIDLEIKDDTGSTAFLRTMSMKSMEYLIDGGANIDAQDNKGMTNLMYAVGAEHYGIVKILTANGANTNLENDKGISALDIALNLKVSPEIIKLLKNKDSV